MISNKKVRYVLIYSRGPNAFMVESHSRPGEFHAVNLDNGGECSCESYCLSHARPCRHLKDLAKLKKVGILNSF